MNTQRLIVCILVMALVTYIPRVLPVTVFRRQIKSRFIRSFLDYTPYAVLGALTFPDILYATGSYISAAAGMFVAIILGFFRRSLVEVAVAAIGVVFFVEIIF